MYPKLHHGQVPLYVSREWRESWRAAGFLVVGWGWLQDDPVVDARVAVSRCRDLDLDGYIANAEAPYEDGGMWKSALFCQEFRRLAPHAPLALSGLVAPSQWRRAFDYRPWLEAGAFFRPQCYDANGQLSVTDAIRYSTAQAGFHVERVQPDLLTSGSYNLPGAIGELIQDHTVGFGFFLGSNAIDDDYRVAGRAIREHFIAV